MIALAEIGDQAGKGSEALNGEESGGAVLPAERPDGRGAVLLAVLGRAQLAVRGDQPGKKAGLPALALPGVIRGSFDIHGQPSCPTVG